MTDNVIYTTYVSRVVALPPTVAQAAFDALPRTWSTGDGRWRLRIVRRDGGTRARTTALDPYRAYRAVISGRVLREAVEIELSPWSSSRTQLGIRTCGRWEWARSVDAAHAIVGELAPWLVRWAETPLRDLLVSPVEEDVVMS